MCVCVCVQNQDYQDRTVAVFLAAYVFVANKPYSPRASLAYHFGENGLNLLHAL